LLAAVAGSGLDVPSPDGVPATEASLQVPMPIALDPSDNLFFADGLGTYVRRGDAITGIITTVAGDGSGGFSGDGLAAANAGLAPVGAIAIDSAGNLYIAGGQRIRRIDAVTQNITTIAGDGTLGALNDGSPATAAHLFRPLGLAVDGAGNVYIAD